MKKIRWQILSFLLLSILYIANLIPGIAQTTPHRWTHTVLSEGKVGMGAAVIGTRIMFFSGSTLLGGTNKQFVSTAELFDINTGQSQVFSIDGAAKRAVASGVGVGTKFIFAGGDNGWAMDRVDIYDTVTKTWSTAQLSLDRYFISGVSILGKALFAGGSSQTVDRPASNVDIYTNTTGVWSMTNLPAYLNSLGAITPYRQNIGGVAYGTKAYFAGGVQGVYEDDNCKYVSVFNALDNSWLPSVGLSNSKTNIPIP